MSTPGPERNPSTVKVDKTSGQGKPPAGSGSAKKAGSRPAGKGPAGKGGGGKGRKPIKAVKVSGGRNWGPIAIAAAVVLLAGGIIGYGVWAAARSSNEASTPWAERAAAIADIIDYREGPNKIELNNQHVSGVQQYETSPPVGGNHNGRWQNCNGDVYTEPIPKEHAVHSMEHGAVWVTYKQGLPADQVETLQGKVEGQDYTLMSPIANLDRNISLQAWGYQLKLDAVDDPRIDEFIRALRLNSSVEPGATCSSGVTATGDVPQG